MTNCVCIADYDVFCKAGTISMHSILMLGGVGAYPMKFFKKIKISSLD